MSYYAGRRTEKYSMLKVNRKQLSDTSAEHTANSEAYKWMEL